MRLSVSKDLTPLKAAANSDIDQQAGNVRKLFITDAPGQDMVYQEKRVEAELIVADPNTNPATVPHITREASLNGLTLFDQAVIILTMAQQWKSVSALIEDRRLGAKAMVAAAGSPAAIELAANVDWSDIEAYANG